MSALQVSQDDNAVDLVAQIKTLIRRIQPHMSHIVHVAKPQTVLDAAGNKLLAYCEPLKRGYVMSSAGLAKLVKPRHSIKKLPQLIDDDSLPAIDSTTKRELAEELTTLLQKNNGTFLAYQA